MLDPEEFRRSPKQNELPKSANEFVQVPMPEVEVRAAYIYRGDLEIHGAAPGCPGCRALLDNNRFRAKHTAECRIRLEELISQSEAGKARLERASHRMTHAIVAKSEKQESARQKRRIDDPNTPDAQVEEIATTVVVPVSTHNHGKSSSSTTARGSKRQAESQPDDPRLVQDGDDDTAEVITEQGSKRRSELAVEDDRGDSKTPRLAIEVQEPTDDVPQGDLEVTDEEPFWI